MNRLVSGALLVFGGFWAVVFGVIWNLANFEDEGPRCSVVGCPPSTLDYYWTVYETSTILAVVGIFAVGLGVWLLIRRHPTRVNREMNPPSS